jgi:hypothetical protein
LPVLPAGARSCRGRSQSRVCAERSGGTRRPQAVAPLTAGFRGDRIARRARTARPLWQCGQRVRDGGDRLAAGAGERRCGGGPRRASPTLRQRAGPPPASGETPRQLRPHTTGALACPALPPVNSGLCPEPSRAARTPKRAFQPWRKVASRRRTSTGARQRCRCAAPLLSTPGMGDLSCVNDLEQFPGLLITQPLLRPGIL